MTTSHDQAHHLLCGRTTELSPFMLAELFHYGFSGFFQPVGNGQVLNVPTAVSGIPMQFSLGGDVGLDVLAFQPSTGSFCWGSIRVIDVVEFTTTNTPGLTYDATADQYTYVWKSPKTGPAPCRKFVLDLKDGTPHFGLFQFK